MKSCTSSQIHFNLLQVQRCTCCWYVWNFYYCWCCKYCRI